MVPELQLPHGDDWDLNLYEVDDPEKIPEGSLLAGKPLTETQRSYLYAVMEGMEKDCTELMDDLQLTTGRRPFKVMELCCKADSGISREVEAMGGTAIRCGLSQWM